MRNWIKLLAAAALVIGGGAQAQDTIKVGSLFETSGFLVLPDPPIGRRGTGMHRAVGTRLLRSRVLAT